MENEELLLKEIDKLRAALVVEQNKNINLLRILKERSNQKRGIIPKKAHDGYIIVGARPWNEHYTVEITRNGRKIREHRVAKVTKVSIQSPWPVSLAVDKEEHAQLFKVIYEIGVDKIFTGNYMADWETTEINIAYGITKLCNLRTGLWEYEVFCTRGIHVPSNRIPR